MQYVNLTEQADIAFRELLVKHTDTFAKSKMDFGYCDLIQHDIDTGDSPSIRQSSRRPPLSSGNAKDEIIEEMIQSGIIQASTFPCASPVCLVLIVLSHIAMPFVSQY